MHLSRSVRTTGQAAVLLCLFAAPVPAADLLEPAYPPPAIRYFPRSDEGSRPPPPLPRPVAACPPGYGRVPTDGLTDPSYVGSSYGLGKPSYYGFTPPLGADDPYGRRLRACP